ncbi:MAG: alpha-glucuronidase family glycosyl hydrolase, partial [Armatimonadota bacterium]
MRKAAAILAMIALTLVLSGGSSLYAAENIYPDPGFENTGVRGVARTGHKAGHLKVGAKTHWVAIGGRIKVEPFARYRVSAYVKANIGAGAAFALYCYEWNNYEWAFVSNVRLTTTPEWRRVETTFVSPYDGMVVHPLGFIDCANCEAWVDDIVVEKIAEPEDVMRELMTKAQRTPDETEILARYFVGKGEMAKARALMEGQRPLTQADIACLLAQHTPDLQERRPLVVRMVRYGGITYNAGPQRFNEITEGFSPEERLSIGEDAVRTAADSVAAARGYRAIAAATIRAGGRIRTCADTKAALDRVAASLERTLAAVGADAAAKAEVQAVANELDAARAELAERRASLGRVVVKIGGKRLSPRTHAIVIAAEPTPQEQHAARDLQYHLELITGRAIPIVSERDIGKRTPIVVGKCALLKKLDVHPRFKRLGLEGTYIRTKGPALVLAGNKRGVLYATYTFLEDYLGCRWFAPDCSTWPTEGTIEVPDVNRRYVPPLEYRATDYPN